MEASSLKDLARKELYQGNKQKAREYLREILAKDKSDEEAWLMFADAAESKTDEYSCLQNVLKINPNNVIATQRLQTFINSSQPPKERPNINKKSVFILSIIALVICVCIGSSATIYHYKNDPKLMRLLSIASPTPTPIPAQPFITNELTPLVIEFRNLDNLAGYTPRNQLSSVMSDMTKSNTNLKILQTSGKVPSCAIEGIIQIAGGEDGIINGYQIFSGLSCVFGGGCDEQDNKAFLMLKAGRLIFDGGNDQVKSDCNGK